MVNDVLRKQFSNFFGLERVDKSGKLHRDLGVVRGNGDLFLTKDEIYFIQIMPSREFHIPLSKIIKVEIKGSHNGKSKWPMKVLRIHYEDNSETQIFGVALGGKFSFKKGWEDDAFEWKEAIEKLINK